MEAEGSDARVALYEDRVDIHWTGLSQKLQGGTDSVSLPMKDITGIDVDEPGLLSDGEFVIFTTDSSYEVSVREKDDFVSFIVLVEKLRHLRGEEQEEFSWWDGQNDTLEDVKMAPELGEGEEVLFSVQTQLGDVIRKNVVVFGTNKRLFVRPKKGRSVAEEDRSRANQTISVDEIQAIRRTGGLGTKKIEVELDEELVTLPSIPAHSDKVINTITSVEGLQKTTWGEESQSQRTAKGLLGSTLASLGILGTIAGAFMGLIFILTGIALTLTIIGAIIGLPLMFIGFSMITGGSVLGAIGVKAGGWGFHKEEEWVRP